MNRLKDGLSLQGAHALYLVHAGFIALVNTERTAIRADCKVNVLGVPQRLLCARPSHQDDGRYIDSVGYVHEEAVGTDV